MAAVSARRIVGPNETGAATSRRARSSSGVKSPSGPTKMPSDGTACPATAVTAFQIGGGGGLHSAPVEQLDLLARARTHHLEVARRVVRQRNRLAGHQLLWNKQSVHGKSIP